MNYVNHHLTIFRQLSAQPSLSTSSILLRTQRAVKTITFSTQLMAITHIYEFSFFKLFLLLSLNYTFQLFLLFEIIISEISWFREIFWLVNWLLFRNRWWNARRIEKTNNLEIQIESRKSSRNSSAFRVQPTVSMVSERSWYFISITRIPC